MIKLNLNKIKSFSNNNSISSKIKLYHNYCDANSFTNHKCPNCGCSSLKRHTTYIRNFHHNDKDYKINILVLKCEECSKHHALIPDFITPYQIYSPQNIFKALNNKYPVYRQLLNYWKKKFKNHLGLFEIQFATNDVTTILDNIINNYYDVYEEYYSKFKRIFFCYLSSQSP